MSSELNPREVLDILKSFGYSGITKDQLKLFVKDLKKLIKHDRRKQTVLGKTDRGTSPLTFNDRETGSPSNPIPQADEFEEVTTGVRERYRRLMDDIDRMAPNPADDCDPRPPVTDPDKLLHMLCSSCGERLASPTQHKAKEEQLSSNGSESSSNYCCCMHQQREEGSAIKKKEQHSQKRCPSFIRSVKSANDKTGPGKSDPVALYQYYQDVWSRQNLPGENPRNDLRWRVRHKMMGPRPQSRIVTPASIRENPPWID